MNARFLSQFNYLKPKHLMCNINSSCYNKETQTSKTSQNCCLTQIYPRIGALKKNQTI